VSDRGSHRRPVELGHQLSLAGGDYATASDGFSHCRQRIELALSTEQSFADATSMPRSCRSALPLKRQPDGCAQVR